MSLAHFTILGTCTRRWPDEAACASDAATFAAGAPAALADSLVRLDGPLGAGKTTFVRHLLRALGIGGRVRSPTYTLLEPYAWMRPGQPPVAVSHFDFYRFDDPDEWSSAGFRDVFAAPGLKLVEWASQAGDLMPPADLVLELEPMDDGGRRVTATACSPTGLALLAAWRGDAEDPAPPAGIRP